MNTDTERYDADVDANKVIVWLGIGLLAVVGVAWLLLLQGCR